MNLRTTLFAFSCLCTLGSMSQIARAERFIDNFSAPLPLHALPGTSSPAPLLWAGTSSGSSQWTQSASQTSLSGVIGGARDTTVEASTLSNRVTLSSTQSGGQYALGYDTGTGTSGQMLLDYGAQSNLNANLSSAVAFEMELAGDLDTSPPRPVPLTVTVVSGSVTAAKTVTLQNDGMVYIPFNQFPGVNFADVDRVKFSFEASNVQAVDYSLVGGLRASACMP